MERRISAFCYKDINPGVNYRKCFFFGETTTITTNAKYRISKNNREKAFGLL